MAPGKSSWEDARALIETQTGPVSSARVLSSGRNSEISVIVHSADEATFVKGRRIGHPQAWTQEREKVTVGMSLSGPVAVWSSGEGAAELHGRDEQPGWASFPRTTPDTQPAAVLESPSTG